MNILQTRHFKVIKEHYYLKEIDYKILQMVNYTKCKNFIYKTYFSKLNVLENNDIYKKQYFSAYCKNELLSKIEI